MRAAVAGSVGLLPVFHQAGSWSSATGSSTCTALPSSSLIDPHIGLQHITQLLAARDAAEVAAAAALDDVIDEPLQPFVEQWSDGDSRDSSPPPPERAPAWLTDDYDLEDAMAAMELYRA